MNNNIELPQTTLSKNLELALKEVAERVNFQTEELSVCTGEDDAGLSDQDVVAILSVGAATPVIATTGTMFITGTIVSKAVATAAFASFGAASIIGTGMYFGYQWIMKSYREEENLRKVQHSFAIENHRNILNQIQEQIRKINVVKEQLEKSGEITVNDIPVRYRENECPIDLEPLVSNDPTKQRKLERLPCGHILHQDCYNSLIRSGSVVCPFDRSKIFPKIPDLPVIPAPIPKYTPKSLGDYIKGKVLKAFKIAKDIASIGAILTGYIVGSTMIFIGAGTIVLWLPTFVPTLIFIGVVNGCLAECVKVIVSTLGLASAVSIGGIIVYSIAVEYSQSFDD